MYQIMKRRWLAIALIVLLTAAVLLPACSSTAAPTTAPTPAPAAPAPEQMFKWKLTTIFDKTDAMFPNVINKVIQKVTDISKGRFQITAYGVNELMGQDAIFDGVRNGVVDMALVGPAAYGGSMPEGFFEFGLPMSWSNMIDFYALMYQFGGADIMTQAYAEKNIEFIGPNPGAGFLIYSKKPLNSVADLKGLKIRATGDFQKLMQNAGAAVTNVALPEIYTALSTGTIDAVCTASATYINWKHYELAKYYINVPLLQPTVVDFIANKDAWNKLPADLRELLRTAVLSVGPYDAVRQNQHDALQILDNVRNKWGGTVITWSDSDMVQLRTYADSILDQHAQRSPRAAQQVKILKDYRTLVGK